jgi:hypothetical protein
MVEGCGWFGPRAEASSVPDEDNREPPTIPAPSACKRWGGALYLLTYLLYLLTYLPRGPDHPPYRIFGCSGCYFLEWIAETISGEN